MNTSIKIIGGLVVAGVIMGGVFIANQNSGGVTLENPQVIEWVKPTTDAQWAEDVKKESLHFKFDDQLTAMKVSHEAKLPRQQKDLDKITLCPECIKWELREQFEADFENMEIALTGKFEGKTLQEWIDGEFAEQVDSIIWGVEKLKQSIERIDNEIRLRESGFLTVIDKIPAGNPARDNIKSNERSPLGTVFYIDADCATPGNGSEPTCDNDANDPFDDILDFTEVNRNAGDIAFVRRGTTALYDDGTDLNFNSDGSVSNPIFISADYDNIDWGGGGDFATSTQTVTPIFGSKFMATSASTTDMFPNEWIYIAGDCSENPSTASVNTCDFAYEIEVATSTGISLFLPYKGAQTSSGSVTRVMPNAPIWGTAATAIQWMFDNDQNWLTQGVHIRGSDTNGNVEVDGSTTIHLKDVILEGNGTGDIGFRMTDGANAGTANKIRTFNHFTSIGAAKGTSGGPVRIMNSLLDNNSVAGSECFQADYGFSLTALNTECVNASEVVEAGGQPAATKAVFRNIATDSINPIDSIIQMNRTSYLFEDFNGTVGDNRQFNEFSIGINSPAIKSTTTPVRSGGGATSIEVLPNTNLSTAWDESRLLLFEYPIYTDTTSRDYQVFFKSDTGTPFAASPTADELWIECEYWGHATNNHRRLLKSTGTVDFTTDADFDQSLTITCAPSQAGILYLRGWYAKTKEGGDDNIFFVDPQPVISDT